MPEMSNEAKEALTKHVMPWLERCNCAVCTSRQWTIAPSIFEWREFFGGSLKIGSGQIIPVIIATCQVCGHIVPFNAIHVGAVKLAGEVKP